MPEARGPDKQPRKRRTKGELSPKVNGTNGAPHIEPPQAEEPIEARRARRLEESKAEAADAVARGDFKPKPTKPPMLEWPEPFPGPLAELVTACQRAAKRKQGAIATLGMFVAMAACIPSVYRMGDGLRCNLYGLGCARTAQGKDAVKKMASLVAAQAGSHVLGAPGSGPGFQDALVPWHPMVSFIDEAHGYFAAGNDRKASPHVAATIPIMLDLYTASASMFTLRMLAAGTKRNTGDVRPPIQHPMFNVMAFSTPERLRGALTVENVLEGLMGRMLVAVGVDNSEEAMDFNTTGLVVPESVGEVIEHLAVVRKQASAATYDKSGPVKCIDVKLGDGVKERLVEMDREDVRARKAMPSGSLDRDLNMRALERVTRIAMVIAIWANPAEPVLDLVMLDWAYRVSRASDSHMLELIGVEGKELSNNDAERNDAERVLRSLKSYAKKGEEGWCPRSALMQNTFGKKRLDAALGFLGETGQIQGEERSEWKSGREYQSKYYRAAPE